MNGEQNTFEISVQLRHHGWNDDIENLEQRCRVTALRVLESKQSPAELSLVLADDDFVRGLNRQFRDQDRATNVLSFPGDTGFEGAPEILGDVVIAYQTTAREAIEAKIKLVDHLSHLIVHGVLHLLGYDHETAEDAKKMESREVEILAGLGVDDPYR